MPMRALPIAKFVSEQEHIEWLIDNLLPNVGWTLFYGTRGIGKTTFAMQLCDSLQEGKPFMGRKTIKTKILFIQADSLADEWREILKRVAPKSHGYTMVSVPEKCMGSPTEVERMIGLVKMVGPGFIVFDSLYNLTAVRINDEGVLLTINTMKLIASEKPWMLIHHPPHEQSRAAGHHSLGGNCSNEWSLLKTKLKIEKGRLVKDKEIALTRNEEGLWIPRVQEEDSGSVDSLMNRRIY